MICQMIMARTMKILLGCYALYFDESAAFISRLKVMNKFVGTKFLQNMANYPQTTRHYISKDDIL